MKCMNCRNEVFYISAHSGEPIFYCFECGVPHFPESAEVRAKRAADRPYADSERVDGQYASSGSHSGDGAVAEVTIVRRHASSLRRL